MTCRLVIRSVDHGRGKPTIAGRIETVRASGLPDGGESRHAYTGCDVTAVAENGARFSGKATRGTYSIKVPAGTYRLDTEACLGCAITDPTVAIVDAHTQLTLDIECRSDGL